MRTGVQLIQTPAFDINLVPEEAHFSHGLLNLNSEAVFGRFSAPSKLCESIPQTKDMLNKVGDLNLKWKISEDIGFVTSKLYYELNG